jgi:hypothetical protein
MKPIWFLFAVATGFLNCTAADAGTIEDIRSSGVLQCGVDADAAHFSQRAADGTWTGMNVAFCQALAAAVVGDSKKVSFTALKPEERIEALQSGEIDVLASTLPVSAQSDVSHGILFSEALHFTKSATGFIVYAPAVRQDDAQWFATVRWVRHALVLADANASFADDKTALPGLDEGWAQRALDASGSYSKIFAEAFGNAQARGLNDSSEKGGLLWTPPLRVE